MVESTDTDPKGRFHPDLKWIKAATSVEVGMVKQADGSFAFSEPAPENAIAATLTPATPLTKLAFMNRFTMEELAAIYTAAKTEVMVEVFEAQYGRKPVVEAIHAGLECGIFSDRLPGLDAVSFGPQMHDIHTSREKLDIASTARTWEYLVAVLERL